MSKHRQYPSYEYLHSRLSYNPDTGHLTWKEAPEGYKDAKRFNTVRAGKRAGRASVGQRGQVSSRYISIDGWPYLEHRIVWIMAHGYIDDGAFIDHINMNPTDNRIENLRLSNNSTNQWNRMAPKNNTSGFKGVTYSNKLGKWKVAVRANGNYIHGGYHATKSEAALACAKLSLRHHGKHSPYYGANGRDFEPNQIVRTERQMSMNNPIQIDN
jgi:hypothetical protein